MKKRLEGWRKDLEFVWQFALDDFKARYAGTGLGSVWAFLQPVVTIILYWFVFQVGFKSQPVENFPFILWLLSGLLPWFLFSEAISNATACMAEYSYLVRKVLFHIKILPFAKVLSAFFVQAALLLFTAAVFWLCGYLPDGFYVLLLVYLAYLLLLTCALAYITATLYVFFKDTVQVVPIILQVVFWFTPIVWDFELMPEAARHVLVFNPLYYIVNGYRNALIYKRLDTVEPAMVVYYWCIAVGLLFFGLWLFDQCKDHFADVLC